MKNLIWMNYLVQAAEIQIVALQLDQDDKNMENKILENHIV